MNHDVERLIADYEALAVAWTREPAARRGNRILAKMHKIARVLRDSEDGREALEGLLDHSLPGVRLNTSAMTLAWDSRKGIRALKHLTRLPTNTGNGLVAFTAEMTLTEYRAGRLTFDWW